MPHFRIEYSANVKQKIDIADFCKAMHVAILETGLFEIGAIRVRAFCAEDYAIADQITENAFIDMHFNVGEGRAHETLKAAGDHIFEASKGVLAPLFATPHFALSFQITEINSSLSWKNNAMHARLRTK